MRCPSAYETRARELAIAAGLDPDSRVARPGEAPDGRGMPAWCGFRDAARAEHLTAEAALVVLPEQEAAYRDAPLQVFGQHDEATLAQMRTCMGVGRVVAGVVCADDRLPRLFFTETGMAEPRAMMLDRSGREAAARCGPGPRTASHDRHLNCSPPP